MSTQHLQTSRRNGTPVTSGTSWEPFAVVGAAIAVASIYGIHVARALANWSAGAGFTMTPSGELLRSLPELVQGHTGAGLARHHHHLASALNFYMWLGAMLAAMLFLVGALGVFWFSRRSNIHGLATRQELERTVSKKAVLGAAKELRPDLTRRQVTPLEVGVHLGTSTDPAGVEVYVRADRTTGVLGPQGSGKSLDALIPALLGWPGGALVTLTKPEDMYLSITTRSAKGPVAVLDPFGLAPGLPELVWDPVEGCEDPAIALRRAKSFCAGTILGSGNNDSAALYYAAESAKVLQAWFHAAAIADLDMRDIMQWASAPTSIGLNQPQLILQRPEATPRWGALMIETLSGDPETVGNTISTIQSALGLFFQDAILNRCVPGPDRPATDIRSLISHGTFYLLGREDPYASASPLMTALTEHVLDTAVRMAHESPYGRLVPPFHAFLDELPSTAPIPTLSTHMANDRGIGVTYSIYAQTPRQLVRVFGADGAQEVWDLCNYKVIFGGITDVSWLRDVSALLGDVTVERVTRQRASLFGPQVGNDSVSIERIPVLSVDELPLIPERHALVLPNRGRGFIIRLHRCIDGKEGKKLLAQQREIRAQVLEAQRQTHKASKKTRRDDHGEPAPRLIDPDRPALIDNTGDMEDTADIPRIDGAA